MKGFSNKTVYQIYPKAYKDSNGDGIGDLNGVIEKLDYLKELGVDYIWLTPFYKSPQNDNGYDIADYYSVDRIFGSMEDFEKLVYEGKKRNIYIMLDMVFNHTSTDHPWFQAALKGDEKYKNYYIFKKGSGNNPPTNWESKFGGNAWEYVEELGEYYLHLFDVTQADLNWENPELREEIYKVVRFWMDKGVKGFRLDVINLISKPDIYENDYEGDGRRFYTDGPRIHEYLKELNKNTFALGEDIITVGEMSSTSIDQCVKYANPEEKELSMVFNFHHLKVDYKNGEKWSIMDFDFMQLKEILSQWQTGMQEHNSWNALFWGNHDQPRTVSRFGTEGEYYEKSAKMLATCQLLMRGTPYIYQGEEIGMTNADFENIDRYRDVESLNYYKILKERGVSEDEIINILKIKSRDNARTPMQWDDSVNGGFSKSTPWIDSAKSYSRINAKSQINNPDSIFNYYKDLIKLKKNNEIISDGEIEFVLQENTKVLAYLRKYEGEKVLVVCNFYGEETEIEVDKNIFDLNNSKKLIGNYKNEIKEENKISLRPYETTAYIIEK